MKDVKLHPRAVPHVVWPSSAETTVTGRRATRDAPPIMLRGLLALSLDKPTKISSIESTLEGKSVVTCPEGSCSYTLVDRCLKCLRRGARKLEVTEENEIFLATTVFFQAGSVQADMAALLIYQADRWR